MPFLNRFTDRPGGVSGSNYSPVRDDNEEHEKMLQDQAGPASLDELLVLRRSYKSMKQTVYILGIILVLCILVLLAGLARPATKSLEYPRLLKTPVPPSMAHSTLLLFELTNVASSVPMETRTFERNALYASRPSPESDAAWNRLLPNGRGFVFIPDWQNYDLPPGEETTWSPIYSVSLFHQLHCLGQIRSIYWKLIDTYHADDTELMDEMVANLLGPDGEHAHHCFDYLRQTLQCAGDMAMEWPRTETDGRRFAVDGWGIPHECKSWDHIVNYMDLYHFNASANAEIAPDHMHHHKHLDQPDNDSR